MVRDDDSDRNFALRESDGSEPSVFSGSTPRQAALKAARRLDADGSESAAKSNAEEIRLREKGTDKVHIYDGWAWTEEPPEVDEDEWDSEDPWMKEVDEITEANVSKKGIEHLDE